MNSGAQGLMVTGQSLSTGTGPGGPIARIALGSAR